MILLLKDSDQYVILKENSSISHLDEEVRALIEILLHETNHPICINGELMDIIEDEKKRKKFFRKYGLSLN